MIQKFYRRFFDPGKIGQILLDGSKRPAWDLKKMMTEWCFYVETKAPLSKKETGVLEYILGATYEPFNFSRESFVSECPTVLEAGPRLNFETAWSTRAVNICRDCTLEKVTRLEYSTRLGIPVRMTGEEEEKFLAMFYDRMTQARYPKPLESFESGLKPAPVRIIPLIEKGIKELVAINIELGLGMDEQDITMCYNLFVNVLHRDPTDVELFQLAAGTFSEHARHNLFNGEISIDGMPLGHSLMDAIKAPWKRNPGNAVVAFKGSVIRGGKVRTLLPIDPTTVSSFSPFIQLCHQVVTAETHNYPTGIAPFFGAETGIGGMIRDKKVGAGRGGIAGAVFAGYCSGSLFIPNYILPWEKRYWIHPENLATGLEIMIGASNGTSAYGNCIGTPVIGGVTRTYESEDRSWIKPIMWVGGVGGVIDVHIEKGKPKKGMLVVHLGGPGYRIGMGGSAASSMIQGQNAIHLDFNAVQRGDAEMEQRVNRLIKACVELGDKNPIIVIQDEGAGGNCNAITELVDPAGAIIRVRSIPIGDVSLSILENWGNESQERYGILIWPEDLPVIMEISKREKVPCAVIGEITGDGMIILYDETDGSTPVNLPLDKILSDLPQKKFDFRRIPKDLRPLEIPEDMTVFEAFNLVLRHPSVCSKGFLTRKVDRCVTAKVTRQQCIGPNHLPLSDHAAIVQSVLDNRGVAISIGEQPIKGLISPEAMVRLAVAEAILNLCGAKITRFEDIKFLANWMLAAKLPGEGAWLCDAIDSLDEMLEKLHQAIIGGKDSLSMAAIVELLDGITKKTIPAPGQSIISAFAPMKYATRSITADIKKPGNTLILVDLGKGKNRLGGSILAQVLEQLGDECPDLTDFELLKKTFKAVQRSIGKDLISSIHDVSDGGRIVTIAEMAFAGNVGLDISIYNGSGPLETFFAEEPGLVIECSDPDEVMKLFKAKGIPAQVIGFVTEYGGRIKVRHNGTLVLDEEMTALRHIWEETSTAIEMLQANPECVREEAIVNRRLVTPPPYRLTFEPKKTPASLRRKKNRPKIAIIREEGSNGDREAAESAWLAGFDAVDVAMSDLAEGRANLRDFRGIIFVGGFTFGDVLGAARGWAAVIKFNPGLKAQFEEFYRRSDTFSLGICNGCQLMPLIGWVPWQGIPDEKQPRFVGNRSQRFESRFSTVEILPSPAIMFRGMEGSRFGIWNAHGEGRLFFPDKELLELIEKQGLAPLRFVDEKGRITEEYPLNCNGSPRGMTALCTPDGRHLAMMGHAVDRTFLLQHWPWMPEDWKDLEASPWMKMLQNAYAWCIENEIKN
ncbi:MAG: phosphoribosylformylglycinamidine synthase [Candidatus Paceibacterota bacterium]